MTFWQAWAALALAALGLLVTMIGCVGLVSSLAEQVVDRTAAWLALLSVLAGACLLATAANVAGLLA